MVGLLTRSHHATEQFRGYVEAVLMVAISALAGLAIASKWGSAAADLMFLPAVLATAILSGLGPALLAALLSALAYNYLFTEPYLSFEVDNANDIVTVVVLFGVAAVVSQLAASVRKQARIAEAHAARNAIIAGLARNLLACTTELGIAEVTTRQLGALFDCNAVLIVRGAEPVLLSSTPEPISLTPGDIAVAALVLDSGERAGRAVDRAIPTEWQFHPVKSGNIVIAAAGLAHDDGVPAIGRDAIPLLDNLLDQVALALERNRLEDEARAFSRLRERDEVRAILLSSIAQDVSPSLTSIMGGIDELKRSGSGEKGIVSLIGSEATKIERYISNILNLGPVSDQRPLEIDGVTIDIFKRAIFRDGIEIHLTPKEYAVLAELSKHPGRVLSHAHLLRTAWGPAHESQVDYLRVAVRGLRQKIERDPSNPGLIINEPAVGYRLNVRKGHPFGSSMPDADRAA